MKKTLYILISCLTFTVINAHAQPGVWQTIQSNPSVMLQDVYFLSDGQNGWAAGATSAAGQTITGICRTTNGGANWSFISIPVNAGLTGVYFTNQSTGWAVGSNGTIMFSSNGGLNWTQQTSPTGRLLAKVYFINSTTGWAAGGWQDGSPYLVIKTTNGGQTWIDQSFSGPGYCTESVFFINAQTGWVGSRDNTLAPKIFKTTNGGTSWVSTNLPALASNMGILSIKFGNSNKGWAATTCINTNGPILFTTDAGDNWTIQYSTNMHYHVLDIRDSNSVAVVGFRVLGGQSENVSVTTNGGANWTQYSPPLAVYTYGICYRGNNIWLAADNTQILMSPNNGVSWNRQYHALRLRSVSWSSPTVGWITAGTSVGNDGLTYKTTDGGNNWFNEPSAPGGSQVFFVNQNYGWMMFEGNSASIYRTSNGGLNWIQSYFPTGGAWIGRMFFINQNTGWGFGSTGKIVYTTNSGASFTAQTSNTSNYVETIFFINPNEGWAGGGYGSGSGFILHTINSGQTWTAQTPALGDHVNDIVFLNSTQGWALDYGGTVQRTTDGGNTWTAAGSVPNFYAMRIVMLDALRGWVCASNQASGGNDGKGFIYKTVNGGDSWSLDWSGSIIKSDLTDLVPQGTSKLWSVGNHNTILKYEIPVGIKSVSSEIPKEFSLYQNYPNPFNPVTKIRFSIPPYEGGKGDVMLKVYDILGNEITTLVNEQLTPGSYDVEFNGTNYPSGTYYCKLIAGDYTKIKKLVLLK